MADSADMLDKDGEDENFSGSACSDTNSDFEDITVDPEDAAKIVRLEAQLEENPNNYDAHTEVRAMVIILVMHSYERNSKLQTHMSCLPGRKHCPPPHCAVCGGAEAM
jgi:hypothetical protein